jgi:hypothetical protein
MTEPTTLGVARGNKSGRPSVLSTKMVGDPNSKHLGVVADPPVIIDGDGVLPDRALELRKHLALLAEERMCARDSGLTHDKVYMEDLELEVSEARFAHAGAVILQVAFLRAGFDGRSQG